MTTASNFFNFGQISEWVRPSVVTGKVQSNDGTLTVGNALIAFGATAGANIDALLTSPATDIDNPDPGDWYNIVNLSGRYYIFTSNNFTITVDTAETAGDALRIQIVLDGVVIGDAKAVRSASGDSQVILYLPSNTFHCGMFCGSSFVMRVCRQGNLADAGTVIGALNVYHLTL